jgi:hypothetical protein
LVPWSEYIVTDIENGKIIPPLKLMTKNEVMNDLLELLGLAQKHADKEGCHEARALISAQIALVLPLLSSVAIPALHKI